MRLALRFPPSREKTPKTALTMAAITVIRLRSKHSKEVGSAGVNDKGFFNLYFLDIVRI
jgi:hypothetical protein